MQASLRRLLSEVIDYAGLFPPAQLGMADAVTNYLRYRSGPEAWIVDRFVCSSSRLGELAKALEAVRATPIPVSVVGRVSHNRESWETALESDARDMNDFTAAGWGDVAGYEIRVPSHAELAGCIRDLKGFDEADVFVELPWGPEMDDSLSALADTEWLGAKGRTGGLTADAFPSPGDLAGFLHACVSLDLDFKLTAGLHHPVRQWREEVQGPMHGFLNVLGATAIIFAEDIPRPTVEGILLEEDRWAFKFTDEGLQWGEHEADLHDIGEARERFVGFGSCSVEEPLSEL